MLKNMLKVKRTLALSLKSREAAVLMQPHLSYRSTILARVLGLPTITFKEAKLSWLAAAKVSRPYPWHETARIAKLFEPLGISHADMLTTKAFLEPVSFEHIRSWEADVAKLKGKLIAIAPGSVWATKRWPSENFEKLALNLAKHDPAWGFVLLGTAKEKEQTLKIENALKSAKCKNVWNLAGQTSLMDLRRLFPLFSLVITNDSSPTHFATAFDIPTLAIFGPTTSKMGFAPQATRNEIVEISLDCRPCSDHGPEVCPLGHFRCMREITSDQVLARALALLSPP